MLFKFRFHFFFFNLGESAFKKISFPIYRFKIRPRKCSGCFTEILLIRARARGKEGDSKHEVIPHGDGVGAASLALQKAPQSAKATTPPHHGDAGPGSGHAALRVSRGAARPLSVRLGAAPVPGGKSRLRVFEKHHAVCRRCWVIGWVGGSFHFCFCFCFFAGRTVIRRKEGWHPGRERAPSPGGAGRGSPAPAGKADPAWV